MLAVGALRLETGELLGEGWRAGRTAIRIDLSRAVPTLDFELEGLSLPAPLDAIDALSGTCPALEITPGGLNCPAATVRVVRDGRSLEPFMLSMAVAPGPEGDRRIRLALPPGGGGLTADLHLGAAGWVLHLGGEAVAATTLTPLVQVLLGPQSVAFTRGKAAISGDLGVEAGALSASLDLRFDDLWFSDPTSLRVGEGVGATLRVRIAGQPEAAVQGSGALRVDAGQMYVDPVFVEVPDTPLALEVEAGWDPASSRLRVDRLSVDHPGVVRVRGRGTAVLGDAVRWEAGRLELPETAFEPLFVTYLQPFLLDGMLGDARVAGNLALSAEPDADGGIRVVMHADDLGVEDGGGRFVLEGLDGVVHWGGPGTPPSRLAWKGIRLYRVPVGAARVRGVLERDRFQLLAPLTLPLLDGELEISSFEAHGLGSDAPAWSLGGELRPLSMEALTEALGWVPLGGTISGEVPAVRYQDHVMRVEGTLLTRVFDGEVALHSLSLERPFGVVPVLRADAEVRGLSLDALTRAFAFGNIRGRLDGQVRGLVLEDWQPRSFDARFATPPGDTSTHRISQRAVDNLARIGGAGSAVSSTFLRLFEDFGYDRLGLSCRLRDGICEIGGVAPAREGFYIVRGSGLPRIDVIGYNQRVDWVTLVERLKSMTAAEGPVVR